MLSPHSRHGQIINYLGFQPIVIGESTPLATNIFMIDFQSVAPAPVSGFFARAYREILADRAPLPSMPDVALRIRAAMQKPNYNANTVARLIKTDPGISAYLMRIANSALYGGVVPIQDLENAIARLGISSTRNLVTSYALRAMFKTRSRVLGKLMRQTWTRSARLAAIAAVIASRLKGFDPDRAMLSGLLQDIGILPLLLTLESYPPPLPEPEQIDISFDSVAAKVGVVLLQKWNFDDEIVEVTRSRKDWWRDPHPEPDLADLVLVARLHDCIGKVETELLPRIYELPAFRKLPLAKGDPDASLDFLDQAQSDIDQVMKILGV